MRRLMKGKRRKSENPSDAESEENGGNAHKYDDAVQTKPDDDDDGESAPKSKRRGARGRDNKLTAEDATTKKDNDNEINNDSSELINHENGNAGKNIDEKRRKKEDRRATTSHDKIESETEYEVERIVSHRFIRGHRQFLIRWKGYDEDADTWEDESELNCSKLIDDFLTDKEIDDENKPEKISGDSQNSKYDNDAQETDKLKKTPKNKRARMVKRTKKTGKAAKKQNNGEKMDQDENESDSEKHDADAEKKIKRMRGTRHQNDNAKKNQAGNKSDDDDDDDDDDGDDDDKKEFEVEKIIDVYFKKNKSREFLIRWKGFAASDDTWEPEANLNCPELITKFMDKVEKAKTAELRELRTNPSHTKRYTLTMQGRGRRLSRRNAGKERRTYHECEN